MKIIPSFKCAAAFCLFAFAITASGSQPRPTNPVASPIPARLGVRTSLTTSGFHFNVGQIIPPMGPPGTVTPDYIAIGPISFPASFRVANLTGSDITFSVPRPNVGPGVMAIYVPNLVFQVYDSQDHLVWASYTAPGTLVQKEEPLPAGSAWRLTAQIPLQINGQWLAGTYTLVASILGTPEFSATATFEVALVPTVAIGTGISGVAVEGPITPVDRVGVPNTRPVPGAVIDISGPLFTVPPPKNAMIAVPVQRVTADANGNFSIALAPGAYRVIGEVPPSSPYLRPSSQQVKVKNGSITGTTVSYDTGIR